MQTIVRHPNQSKICGAEGFIAYEKGKAWSVHISMDGQRIHDWRYDLDWQNFGVWEDRTPNKCAECERHILAANREWKKIEREVNRDNMANVIERTERQS